MLQVFPIMISSLQGLHDKYRMGLVLFLWLKWIQDDTYVVMSGSLLGFYMISGFVLTGYMVTDFSSVFDVRRVCQTIRSNISIFAL